MIVSLLHRLRRLWRPAEDTLSSQDLKPSPVSDQALLVARQIRGYQRKPTLILHGVTPRSGTGYITNLLGLHPDLYKHPNEIWEIPFLQRTDRLLAVQKGFFDAYPLNRERMGENDFLPLFGASFIAYLHSFVVDNRQVLMTVPSVAFLDFFYTVFPYEIPVLLLRDGRDVVTSTVKTWPDISFAEACRRWDAGARAILDFQARYTDSSQVFWLGKYEDAVQQPELFVRAMCRHLGLDESRFPFAQIADIPLIGGQEGRPGHLGSHAQTQELSKHRPLARLVPPGKGNLQGYCRAIPDRYQILCRPWLVRQPFDSFGEHVIPFHSRTHCQRHHPLLQPGALPAARCAQRPGPDLLRLGSHYRGCRLN